MNILLSIKKSFLFIIISIIFIFICIFFVFEFLRSYKNNTLALDIDSSEIDIINPKFTINSKRDKITISAKEGHFINDNEILLKDNVKFYSNDFEIESDDVIFDRTNFTASSEKNSKFKSKKTIISSKGFEIIDSGNKINFNGETKIIIK